MLMLLREQTPTSYLDPTELFFIGSENYLQSFASIYCFRSPSFMDHHTIASS